jgi:hypothetical protein
MTDIRRQVLMLDFDGVLHPAQGDGTPEFARLPLLVAAVAGTRCEIVISSTWREHYPQPHLRALLGPEIGARVVGVLGADHRGPYVRYQNILAWLKDNAPAADWRAVDDSAAEFPPGWLQLLLCNGITGLDRATSMLIREWLVEGG